MFRLAFIIVSVTVNYVVQVWQDEPHYDDSHLIPVWRELADEDNAFSVLEQAYQAQDLPAWRTEERDLFELHEGKPVGSPDWDVEFIEGILAKNAETLRLLDRAIQMNELQPPPVRSHSCDLSYLRQWRSLAYFKGLHATHLFNSGNHQVAMDEALKTVRIGSMMERSEGAITTYLVSGVFKSIGLRNLREMLPAAALPSEAFIDVARQLEQLVVNKEVTDMICGAEYMICANYVNEQAATSRFHFKPNKTKRFLGEVFTTLMHNMSSYASERESISDEVLKVFMQRPSVWAVVEGNSYGQDILRLITPGYDALADTKCRRQVDLQATRLLFALRAYKLDRGELPGSLDALVPNYISAVPSDDYDGEPLRYCPERRMIYSIGKNLIDNGGDGDDMVFRIEF